MNAWPGNSRLWFNKKGEYQKLLKTLKAFIDDGQATALDLSARSDELSCGECGAVEDFMSGEKQRVLTQDRAPTPYDTFIIVDAKKRHIIYREKDVSLYSYYFICPVCGLYQLALLREDEEETV